MIVISNTSPVTNLAAIGQLDLLRQLYASLIIPNAVYNEMVKVDKIVPGAVEVQSLPWIQTQAVVDFQRVAFIQASQNNIDTGETEAIVLALELKADLLLMDERRGRILATSLGLNVIGLLGILVQAKRNGLIPAVKPLMDRLIEEAGFRLSSQLYATVLQSQSE